LSIGLSVRSLRVGHVVAIALMAVGVVDAGDKDEVASSTLLPLVERDATFKVTAGERRGQTVRVSIASHDDHWRLIQPDFKTRHVTRGEDGALLMSQSYVKHKDSRLSFDPAVPLLPSTMAPGAIKEFRAAVRVTSLDGKRVKASGDCVRRVELLGQRRIEIGDEEVDVYRVRATERFDFTLAHVRVVTTTDFVPGVGQVRQQVSEKITRLGIFSSRSSYTLERAERWDVAE